MLSVRTPERPMAFTSGEFAGGAGIAFGVFLILIGPATLLSFAIPSLVGGETTSGLFPVGMWIVGIVFGAIVVGAGAAGVTLAVIGWPIALAAGILLRGQRNRVVHGIVFAIVGLVVGAIGTATTFTILFASSLIYSDPAGGVDLAPFVLALPFPIATAIATTIGWLATSQLAFRRDRRAGFPVYAV